MNVSSIDLNPAGESGEWVLRWEGNSDMMMGMKGLVSIVSGYKVIILFAVVVNLIGGECIGDGWMRHNLQGLKVEGENSAEKEEDNFHNLYCYCYMNWWIWGW